MERDEAVNSGFTISVDMAEPFVMKARFFDVIEVIEASPDGRMTVVRSWITCDSMTEEANRNVLRRAHEMANNIGGMVIGKSPTLLSDYRAQLL